MQRYRNVLQDVEVIMDHQSDCFYNFVFGPLWSRMKKAMGVDSETPLGHEVERLMNEARAAVIFNHKWTLLRQRQIAERGSYHKYVINGK